MLGKLTYKLHKSIHKLVKYLWLDSLDISINKLLISRYKLDRYYLGAT